MTDHEHENAQLAAWLAGDIDDAEAAALERRLETEPALGARLDAMAATLARLRRYDAVELPPGTADRLHARLTSERRGPATGPADAGVPGNVRAPRDSSVGGGGRTAGQRTAASPGPGGITRPSGRAGTEGPGRERTVRRVRLAGIAAAVLVVVIGIGGLLPLLNRGPGGESADSAAVEVAAEDEAAEEETLAEESSEAAAEALEEDGAVSAASEEERAAAEVASAAPVVVDSGAPLGLAAEPRDDSVGDDAAPAAQDTLAGRFLSVPEAQALLGTPLDEAREVARAFVAELLTAPALASVGTAPSACLDTVLPEDTAVPARVEGFTLDGSPALAYVVVRANPGAQVLDAVQVVVTDPRTCAVLVRS